MKIDKCRYVLGSVLNHVLLHQSIIGQEVKAAFDKYGIKPDIIIGCAGGGSNLGGLISPFMGEKLAGKSNIRFIADMATLVEAITGKAWAERVPKGLPVYNIAGDQDPVGAYGEGVYAVSNWLADTGHRKVSTKLYSGHRHEIHNDRDIRDEVVDGIIKFIDKQL